MTLAELAPGESGTIRGFTLQDRFTLRLMALGFTPRARVECLFRAPFGDPTAYRVRRTVICIRRAEAGLVLLDEPCYNAGKTHGGDPDARIRPDPVRPEPRPVRTRADPRPAGHANHPL